MLIKRVFDVFVSLFGLILLFPLMLLMIIGIKLTSKGTIFFLQERVGLYGKTFFIFKFRSMIMHADNAGIKITTANDNRITKFGKFLRYTKIDELPQLINVLKGDMSIVGPRPEVPEFVKYYPHEIKLIIFSVRPGITDLASLLMINEGELLLKSSDPLHTYIYEILPIKLKLSVDYIKNRSMFNDIKIILLTLKKIILR